MNIDCDNEDGNGPSTGVSYNIKMDHNSPSKPVPQQSGCVTAEDGKRPSLPTFEGIPLEIRVIIYRYILINDADISLRSASEMRNQTRSFLLSYSLSMEWWHQIPNMSDLATIFSSLPVEHSAPQFSLLQNTGILFASRKINEEASQILYANNNFHYSCMRSFPGATVDLLANLPWPLSFPSTQLYLMKNLSLDYCNAHHYHWTDATDNDIDDRIARNINHISEACPSLKTFSLYTFTSSTLTPRFHKRLGTGQTVLAIRNIRKRLDWLNLVSTWPFSAIAVFGQTIAPGAVWHCCRREQSGLPKVTVRDWQAAGVDVLWDRVHVFKLDCKKVLEKDEVEFEEIASKDAGDGVSLADADQKSDHGIDLDTDETYSGSVFGSG